jgi:Arc/MetJ-type ribon-helix-helix transcriptional regulator
MIRNMTIHLPQDLESSILAEVRSGHFASVDEAMAEAARLLLRQRKPEGLVVANAPPSEAEFKRQLLKSGLMSSLPTPPDPATRRSFEPLTLEGEPLSETIIRERR